MSQYTIAELAVRDLRDRLRTETLLLLVSLVVTTTLAGWVLGQGWGAALGALWVYPPTVGGYLGWRFGGPRLWPGVRERWLLRLADRVIRLHRAGFGGLLREGGAEEGLRLALLLEGVAPWLLTRRERDRLLAAVALAG